MQNTKTFLTRKEQSKKITKFAKGLPIFFGEGVEMLSALTLELAFALPAVTSERHCPNHPQARQAGLGGYGR